MDLARRTTGAWLRLNTGRQGVTASNTRRWRSDVALLIALLLASALPLCGGHAARAQTGNVVPYHAGWNLVAAPTGTLFDAAQGPAYGFDPDSGAYYPLSPGEAVGGRGVWLYFPQDTTLTLGETAAEFSRVIAPAGKRVLIGNPSTTETLAISGADAALGYEPGQDYRPVSELAPGRAAFVRVAAGGEITLGKPPGDAVDAELRRLQAALLGAPTDRATVEQVSGLADEAVRLRRYDRVQATHDDLRAAQVDGLHRQGSGPLPPLSRRQRASAEAVRQALAAAKRAVAAGNLDRADTLIAEARRAAQAAADDGITLAKGGDSEAAPGQPALAWSTRTSLTGLAAAGALLRSTMLATGLGIAPREEVWTLVDALVSGQLLLPDLPPPPAPPPGVPPSPPPPPPATGGACEVDPGGLALDAEEQALFSQTNDYRMANGLPPLQLSTSLQRSAAWKTTDMLARRVYDHDDGFRTWDQRFKDCGYSPPGDFFVAENLAGGNPSGPGTLQSWQASPVHDHWLLRPDFRLVGIKRARASGLPPGDPHSWVWVMEFGTALDDAGDISVGLP